MGYAPLLALLGAGRSQRGYKRLAVVGIPCQVYALRALEAELGFERLYVIGTPCSDNTTTERFPRVSGAFGGRSRPAITYLEFRADYHVELRFADGAGEGRSPFPQAADIQAAAGLLPADLPDLRRLHERPGGHHGRLHGRPGANNGSWSRNERGEELLSLLGDEVRTAAPTSAGKRAGAVKGFMANVERAAGGVPLRRMPDWCARSSASSCRKSAHEGSSSPARASR